MGLTWPITLYPINITSIVGIWKTDCLIPPVNAELMGRNRRKKEGHYSLCLRDFPKENLILTHYMLSAWWFHLLDGLGNNVIHPREVA